jgi:hypothetical protein
LTLVLLLGGMISLQRLPYETIGVALFLFVIARPLSVYVGLMGAVHAHARHDRMVRRARHRLHLLPGVCDRSRPAAEHGQPADRHRAGRHHAVDTGARLQRQAADRTKWRR